MDKQDFGEHYGHFSLYFVGRRCSNSPVSFDAFVAWKNMLHVVHFGWRMIMAHFSQNRFKLLVTGLDHDSWTQLPLPLSPLRRNYDPHMLFLH